MRVKCVHNGTLSLNPLPYGWATNHFNDDTCFTTRKRYRAEQDEEQQGHAHVASYWSEATSWGDV